MITFASVIDIIMQHIVPSRAALLPPSARNAIGITTSASRLDVIVIIMLDAMQTLGLSRDNVTIYRWGGGQLPVPQNIRYYYLTHPEGLERAIFRYIIPLIPRPDAIISPLVSLIDNAEGLRDADYIYLRGDGTYNTDDAIAALIMRIILWGYMQR